MDNFCRLEGDPVSGLDVLGKGGEGGVSGVVDGGVGGDGCLVGTLQYTGCEVTKLDPEDCNFTTELNELWRFC